MRAQSPGQRAAHSGYPIDGAKLLKSESLRALTVHSIRVHSAYSTHPSLAIEQLRMSSAARIASSQDYKPIATCANVLLPSKKSSAT
ncbi:hypothetical protein B5X24_HaOG207185 [Helicoverpa armigera]|nr:hypothetical protein B5X24_HaOG207185 [Helicoverpa armigera]